MQNLHERGKTVDRNEFAFVSCCPLRVMIAETNGRNSQVRSSDCGVGMLHDPKRDLEFFSDLMEVSFVCVINSATKKFTINETLQWKLVAFGECLYILKLISKLL